MRMVIAKIKVADNRGKIDLGIIADFEKIIAKKMNSMGIHYIEGKISIDFSADNGAGFWYDYQQLDHEQARKDKKWVEYKKLYLETHDGSTSKLALITHLHGWASWSKTDASWHRTHDVKDYINNPGLLV